MRILLTNDDGIHAPGINAVRDALAEIGEVFMVAPERQRSAAGHAITLHKPLRLTPLTLLNGQKGFATNGTPTDCVTLGYDVVMESKCDLVVSGINAGPNLGWDLTYSGTVAAAIEGAVLGIPSFAISVAAEHGVEIDYAPAAKFAMQLAKQLLADPLPPNTLLNVNVRRCYGFGGAVTRRPGKPIGLAWPSAEVGGVPIEGGVDAAFKRLLQTSPDPEAKRKEIQARLPPLLIAADPLARITELYTQRDVLYREVANRVIDADRERVIAFALELEAERGVAPRT